MRIENPRPVSSEGRHRQLPQITALQFTVILSSDMESNVLNHKSEQGKSQTKKKSVYLCVCAHTYICGCRIGVGRAFPDFLQCAINFVQASSHCIEFILKLDLILSLCVIQCNLGNGVFFKSCLILRKIMNDLVFLLPVELIVLALKSARKHWG